MTANGLNAALGAAAMARAAGLTGGAKGIGLEPGCFTAGTLVQTEDGSTPIEDIKAGDHVLARNETDGTFKWCEVAQTFVRLDQEILAVEFEGQNSKVEKIQCTIEHPFWVKEQGWIAANALLPGNEVFTYKGGWIKIKSSTWFSENQTVYNFEVKGLHNYFVGESGLWVHNNSAKLSSLNESAENLGRIGDVHNIIRFSEKEK